MSKEREREIMSICRKREKKYVSIRAHIIILILLTTEVHSGEGSDNYPGYFKQKKKKERRTERTQSTRRGNWENVPDVHAREQKGRDKRVRARTMRTG